MVGSDEFTAYTPHSFIRRVMAKFLPHPHTLRVVFILGSLTCSVTAFAEIFKWTDAKGRIHYGDQLPPEQVEKEHNELTKSGVTTKSIDRNKTAEERTREENQKKKLDEEHAARTEREKSQGVRDRALLETYFNETDLIRMRDQRVATIEGTIKVTQSNLETMQTQVKLLEEEVSAQPENSDTRKKSQTKLSNAKNQLESYEKFITNKREEQIQIRRQFDTDLTRFRELRGDPKEGPKVAPQQQSNAPTM